jgi:hypothetical protein
MSEEFDQKIEEIKKQTTEKVKELSTDFVGDVKSKNIGKYILYFSIGFVIGVIVGALFF